MVTNGSGPPDREQAKSLHDSMDRLRFAVDGLFDARRRGDQDDFEFYKNSLSKILKAVDHWAAQLKVKEDK